MFNTSLEFDTRRFDYDWLCQLNWDVHSAKITAWLPVLLSVTWPGAPSYNNVLK